MIVQPSIAPTDTAPRRAPGDDGLRCIVYLVLAGLASALSACRDNSPKGEAPPPEPSVAVDACSGQPIAVEDSELAALLIGSLHGFCRDPNDQPRVYGVGAPNALDSVCVQLFNGECEHYKAFGLDRVASFRYLQGQGGTGVVTGNLSRFATPEGAFAFYSHRVVGDGDPAQLTTRPLSVPGQGALGAGIAYVRRGPAVLELTFTDERQAPDAMRAAGDEVLPVFGRALASRLRGDVGVPLEAALLPEAERLPLGVRLYHRDALDIVGAGRAAVGYYRRGQRGYAVFVAQHKDEGSAKDVAETLRRSPGAKKLKDMPYEAFELRHRVAAETGSWLVGRYGTRLVGVGDDPYLFKAGMQQPERDALVLTVAERVSLLRQVMSASSPEP